MRSEDPSYSIPIRLEELDKTVIKKLIDAFIVKKQPAADGFVAHCCSINSKARLRWTSEFVVRTTTKK